MQTTGASTPGARPRRPPSRLEGTIAIGSGGLDVYSARGSVAGGSVTANGRLALDGSAGEGLAVTASGLDAAQLRGTGLPLDRGRIAAVGTVGAARAAPFADASVMLGGGGYGALDLSGHSDVRLEGGNLTLAGGSALVDGTLSRFDGRLSGARGGPALRSGALDPRGRTRAALCAAAIRSGATSEAPSMPTSTSADGEVRRRSPAPCAYPRRDGERPSLPGRRRSGLLRRPHAGCARRHGDRGDDAGRLHRGRAQPAEPLAAGHGAERRPRRFQRSLRRGRRLGRARPCRARVFADAGRRAKFGEAAISDLRYRRFESGRRARCGRAGGGTSTACSASRGRPGRSMRAAG